MQFRLKAVALCTSQKHGKDIIATLTSTKKRHHWVAHLSWVSREDPRSNGEVSAPLKDKKEVRAQNVTFEWIRICMAQLFKCPPQQIRIEGAPAWQITGN